MFGAFAQVSALAAEVATNCSGDGFLGIPNWYKYLEFDPNCEIVTSGGLLNDAIPWLIAAAVLEILLRIVAVASFVMVIWGGYRLMTSGGSSDAVSSGQRTIIAAATGFAIAVMATVMVSYLVESLVGTAGTDPSTGLPQVIPDDRLSILTGLVYRIATGLTVIFVAMSGFNFTTSGGDSQKVAKARNQLIYALVGLAVVLLAGVITTFFTEAVS